MKYYAFTVTVLLLWLFPVGMPAAVRYVDINSQGPTPPYASWSTAATNIQDAVDAALAGDQVLVTNGIYRDGGRLRARVRVEKQLIIQSVNGPQFTFIDGGGTGRCVSVQTPLPAALLSGVTLTNGGPAGPTGPQGAGIFGGELSNCVLTGNAARLGGAAAFSTLIDCKLIGNSAWSNGGAAYYCTLTNCTLAKNSASVDGGGAYFCNLSNCLLTNNSASSNGGGSFSYYPQTLDRCTLARNVANNGGGAYGGILTNCTLVGNRSLSPGDFVNPGGGGAASGATLRHCKLENNFAVNHGGGAYRCSLDHCTLSGNQVVAYLTPAGDGGGAYDSTLNYCTLITNSARYGGGAAFGQLYNCLVIANSAAALGGGVYDADELRNCTIVGNSVSNQYAGGGVWEGRLYNCIVYYNTNPFDWDNYGGGFSVHLYHCCIWPPQVGPVDPDGNISTPPKFADTNGWSNLRLDQTSSCINAGDNTHALGLTDLDGRPRIISWVDIGAYEFIEPFNDWLQQYGLATDGSADFIDSDNDGLNNYQESVTGTDPTNSIFVLHMLSPATDLSGLHLAWQSVSNRTYFVERARSLAGPAPFSTIASNIPGQPGTTSYTDTNAPGPFFYRVGVQP